MSDSGAPDATGDGVAVGSATAGAQGAVTVEAINQSGFGAIDVVRWARVAADTLTAENVGRGHLDLAFVDLSEMAELNQVHMGHEGPTDVLSFPLDGEEATLLGAPGGSANVVDGGDVPVLLGDVVVCPEVAVDQAPDHCGDFDAEITLLIVHGVLHILGHDHADPDDAAVMITRETAHLQRYDIAHPGPQRRGPTAS